MKIVTLLLLATLLTSCGFTVVDVGSRGIRTTFGEVIGEPLPEGLYFFNPFTSSIYEYSVREDKHQASTEVFTRDTQKTIISYAVVWYPEPSQVHNIYKHIGGTKALETKIIQPVILGTIKDVVGQIIADDLVSKRELATKTSLEAIQRNLKDRHIIVTDLQFTNLDFDDAYEQAVEEKVVAIQNAQKAKNESVQVEERAKQTVMSAKADAEAMKIKSEALSKNQNLVQYEMVLRWDGKLPQYMMGSTVPLLNLDLKGK